MAFHVSIAHPCISDPVLFQKSAHVLGPWFNSQYEDLGGPHPVKKNQPVKAHNATNGCNCPRLLSLGDTSINVGPTIQMVEELSNVEKDATRDMGQVT